MTEEERRKEAASTADAVYKTKVVQFLGRSTPIVLQNDNGPCPLLAICNVLLLRNIINLNLDDPEVSQQKLLSLVAERLIDSNSNVQDKDDEYVNNQQQNIADAIDMLPRLTTGIDVNIHFRKINDFEFTRECAIFDLLDIALYHGWIVDPQDIETASVIGSKSYNTLVADLVAFETRKSEREKNKQIEEEDGQTVDFAAATTAVLGVPSPSLSRGCSFDDNPNPNPNPNLPIQVPVEEKRRRGDIEEEEELTRVLNLSKSEIPNPNADPNPNPGLVESYALVTPVDSLGSSSVNGVESERFNKNAPKKDLIGNHNEDILSTEQDNLNFPTEPLLEKSNGKTVISDNSEGNIETPPVLPLEEKIVLSDVGPTDSVTVPSISNEYLNGPGMDGTEPMYQGEEHILDSRVRVSEYESPEPVYEGEVVLAEQAEKREKDTADESDNRQCQLIKHFLENNASQLTFYGLFCLQEGLKERELCVFFRNNHFSTMFKYNGELYLLVTDLGYIHQPDLVWEKLNEVNGDTVFMTGNFTQFKAENRGNESWNEQQAVTSTADYLATLGSSDPSISVTNSDLQLAIALQQQEFEQQQQQQPQQQRQQQQQQQQLNSQQPPLTSGRSRLIVGPQAQRPPSNAPHRTSDSKMKEKCTVM